MDSKRDINQVFKLNPNVDLMSKTALLLWMNDILKTTFSEVNQLCTGAAFCQIMHILFPNDIPFYRVRLFTDKETDGIYNFKLLDACFQKLGVKKNFNIGKLVKGNLAENLSLLQWFKKFYDENTDGSPYDAIEMRNGFEMGYGRNT